MMGSWHLISASGLILLLGLLRRPYYKLGLIILITLIMGWDLTRFSLDYLHNYPKKYAIEWQYGMKEVVNFVKRNPEYDEVFMTEERSQPYIFFLYYLQTPPDSFLKTQILNTDPSRSHNLVSRFDRFHFGGWDPIESYPTPRVLYIITPSQYDGLRYKAHFYRKEIIYRPDKTEAFYLVSVY
jgi:hypothetical protein